MSNCAWCMDDDELAATQDESHGICEPHAELVLTTHRYNRVPSYVEENAEEFVEECDELGIDSEEDD